MNRKCSTRARMMQNCFVKRQNENICLAGIFACVFFFFCSFRFYFAIIFFSSWPMLMNSICSFVCSFFRFLWLGLAEVEGFQFELFFLNWSLVTFLSFFSIIISHFFKFSVYLLFLIHVRFIDVTFNLGRANLFSYSSRKTTNRQYSNRTLDKLQ